MGIDREGKTCKGGGRELGRNLREEETCGRENEVDGEKKYASLFRSFFLSFTLEAERLQV